MAKLYFRYGAMNSGKTTMLLQVAHNYSERNMKTLIIKSTIDKKGGNKLVSRLGLTKEVDILFDKKNSTIENNMLKDVKCILVDEAQFLTTEQVKYLFTITKTKDIPVICYGLKSTFKGTLFTGSEALFIYADELDELITVCRCGRRAKFNARIINDNYVLDGPDILIDGVDKVKYESLCGKCYLNKVINNKKM